jgi:hypothetical protein
MRRHVSFWTLQNIPKEVTLLQRLLQLKELPDLLDSTTEHCQQALSFLAEVLGYFLHPFITVDIDLSEQVQSLATYAYLASALHIKHRTTCLTGALYADSQAVVKNIIFTIAQMQIVDSNLPFFIPLEGTDCLEGLFADFGTQDHAQNFDIEQLASKLSVAALINSAMELNPDLDRGHCQLSLKGAMGVDHVNLTSWTGNVCVGNVNLKTEWERGQSEAEKTLFKYFRLTLETYSPSKTMIF